MNWKNIIQALRDGGYTLTAIADQVGASPSSISELYQGRAKDTSYRVGEKLVSMYRSNQIGTGADKDSTPHE